MKHYHGVKVDGMPVLGIPWMAVTHERRDDTMPPKRLAPDVDLMTRVVGLEGLVESLNARLVAVESRTWWSMLKDWVKSLWN